MTVLRKEPGRQWEIVEIENTLEALQERHGRLHRDRQHL